MPSATAPVRPPVHSVISTPAPKTEFNAIPSDKTVERRGRISSARETICGGDGGRIKTGEWRGKAGKSALIIFMPAGGTAEQEFKVEVCGREERNKYGRKGSEAVKRSCSK